MFTGDSITDAGRSADPSGLGEGYVALLAADPALAGATVVNTGIGGNRLPDLLARLDRDVAAHRPELVSVMIGINDTWRRYDSDDPTTTADFHDGYARLLEQLDLITARVVLMEPFLLPVTADQATWREDLDPKIAVVRDLAADHGALLIRTDELLNARAHEEGTAALAADGVHPTPRGHRALAEIWRSAVADL